MTNNPAQRPLRLSKERMRGESAHSNTHRQRLLGTEGPRTVHPQKLLADLLKRQARAVMRSVTTCEPSAIPAHVARIDSLLDIIRHAREHGLIADVEQARTEAALVFAVTVADLQEALLLTRDAHRAPSFVHALAEDELSTLHRKIDTIAGLLAQNATLDAILNAQEEA
jgi:hypothetical protein